MAQKKKSPKKKPTPKTTTKVKLSPKGIDVQRKNKPSGISYGFSAGKGYKGFNISIPITKRNRGKR